MPRSWLRDSLWSLPAPLQDADRIKAPCRLDRQTIQVDGLILGPLNTPKYLTEVVHPNLKKGMDQAGRSPNEVEVCVTKICAVNQDPRQARALARQRENRLAGSYVD